MTSVPPTETWEPDQGPGMSKNKHEGMSSLSYICYMKKLLLSLLVLGRETESSMKK